MPCQPAGRAGGSIVLVSAVSVIWYELSLAEQLATDVDKIISPARQQAEQDQPDQQQEMPVDGAELHAQPHLAHLSGTEHLGCRSAEGHQTANQMQSVCRGDQVEEGIGWIGRHEIAGNVQLLPYHQLPRQE